MSDAGFDAPRVPGVQGALAGPGGADDPRTVAPSAPMRFSPATIARFDREVAKFPPDQKQSAVMACLAIVQQEQGFVSAQAEAGIAAHLGMPPIAVHEVTTFYNMYNQQPVGAYKLNVCTNLPCALRDGDKALDHLCKRLGVEPYGTTADGAFTVQPSECLGACADAPVMLVNDREMLSFMSPERLDDLIATLRQAPRSPRT